MSQLQLTQSTELKMIYIKLKMLKIASFFIKNSSFKCPFEKYTFHFSEEKLNKINDQTFKLIMKRLQQKTIQSKQIQQTLMNSANDQKVKANSESMRIQLNKLSPLVSTYQQISTIGKNILDIQQMLKETNDSDQKSILQEQIVSMKQKKQELKQTAIDLLIPPDSYDDVSEIYLQFRPGAGGSQSAIFVEDISQMFMAYVENQGWRVSIVSQIKETVASKGYKYLKLKVCGEECYKIMKCEAGVHKVIRVPQTQNKGRLHSSTISMVVMPSIPFTFQVNNNDIKYQYTRSSGAGGQSVQKTDSACRATHIPTGTSVFIQQQRSQDQNRKRAVQILKQRLFEIEYQKTVEAQTKRRKSQMGTMDRSQKIRTYNYPQDRITDHRTGLTFFGIQNMMSGGLLQKFIDAYMNRVYEQKLQYLMQDLKLQQKNNKSNLEDKKSGKN